MQNDFVHLNCKFDLL